MSGMLLFLGMGPYLFFRKLSNAFSFKFCAVTTLAMGVIMVIFTLLHISPISGARLVSVTPAAIVYGRKWSEVAQVLGM